MDPLSITVGTFSLLGSVGKLAMTIQEFAVAAAEVRGDLDAVSEQLAGLEGILFAIHGHVKNMSGTLLDRNFLRLLSDRIEGCDKTVDRVAVIVDKFSQGSRAWSGAKWALYGHADMAKARTELDRHNALLNIAVDVFNM
jgi:hypothetical protein